MITTVQCDCIEVSLSLVSLALFERRSKIGNNEAKSSPAPQFEMLKDVD